MLTILIALAVVVAGAFTAVFTRTLPPMNRFTWDGRILTTNQAFNRESLRRVALILSGAWGHARRTARLEFKRALRVFKWGIAAYCTGYFVSALIHALVLLVIR